MMGGFFSKLARMLFGESGEQRPGRDSRARVQEENPAPMVVDPIPPSPSEPAKVVERKPYFVQVGFDFGTAFCKCVCRDVFTDKAWVHLPSGREGAELPFLIPAAIGFDGGKLQHRPDVSGAYHPGMLQYVKMALQKVALQQWDDPVLLPYSQMMPGDSRADLAEFVRMCAIYLIAGVMGGVSRDVQERFPGHVDGDYLAVNMAVPVADAQNPEVNMLFEDALRLAWCIKEDFVGYSPVSISELVAMMEAKSDEVRSPGVVEACCIYPEVSANVQGFVRSRTSREGLYLFSDTGAGTVDQSIFLFVRRDGQDHLAYLHADVLPFGSATIERLAAQRNGGESYENLEHWRLKKEAGDMSTELRKVRYIIEAKLGKGTLRSIARAKQKLWCREQINRMRVIFGGGGHCKCPYRSAVMDQFDQPVFDSDKIHRRRGEGSLDLGMPVPGDLNVDSDGPRWMSRLAVAYGLSFEKGELATFKLPKEMEKPTGGQVWKRQRVVFHAPSKDET
jgi:hypothetical protein